MKKNILVVAVVLVFGLSNAQTAKFGIKGGMNISNWVGDTEGLDVKSKIGFNIGGFAEIKLSDKFSIQPELLYSAQGMKVDNFEVELGDGFYSTDVKFNLAYLNVPVMFKYYAAEKFNLEAGPQVGFLTSAKLNVKVDGYGSSDQDVKDNFESVDFGLNFGAGYDFTEHFFANVRYNLGLSNIAKTEGGEDATINNSVFSLNVGYKF
ncbi:porin family protein [Flavobacterium sp. W22_SRS_FK3]|uniref:porin family protein n=1 Tax=Flavobacterium sp. W22_SRS_FK3 TaxID=3240275 RepID=UPI003F8F1385